MVSYATRVPAGFPGAITRVDSLTISPEPIDSATPPTAYGSFVKLVAGKLQPLAASDAGTVPMGMLVRSYPTQSTSNGLGASAPPTSGIVGVMRRGFMAVTLVSGTAVRGAGVFVVTTAGGSSNVGDIVTSASPSSGGTAVAVSNCVFEGAADANGIVEVAYRI